MGQHVVTHSIEGLGKVNGDDYHVLTLLQHISDLLKKVSSRGSRWPECKLVLVQEVHWWFDQCRVDELIYD